MRKLIIIAVLAALASFIVAATASADVARNQGQTTTSTQTTTATFTVTQPAGAEGQWDNVWTHNYTVTVNPDNNTFEGTGHMFGHDQGGPYEADETITGQLGTGEISFVATRATDGLVTTLNHAPYGGAVTIATLNVQVPWTIEMKVTQPELTTTTKTTTTTTDYKNHGDYVSSMGGGAEAAHSPIGKPVQAKSK